MLESDELKTLRGKHATLKTLQIKSVIKGQIYFTLYLIEISSYKHKHNTTLRIVRLLSLH